MANFINNVASLVPSVIEWVVDVVEAALGIDYVMFFVILGIVGIMFRYAKGILSIR